MTRATYLLRLDPATKERWQAESARLEQSLGDFITESCERRFEPHQKTTRNERPAGPRQTRHAEAARQVVPISREQTAGRKPKKKR